MLVINLLSFGRVSLFPESISAGLSPDLMISLAILAFVLVMEIWIWVMRLRVKSGLRLLEGLSEDYRLVRNESA